MHHRTHHAAPGAGQLIFIAALAAFIVMAIVRRVNTPVLWNSDTATIIASDDVLRRWPDGRLDINSATEAELCLLPGIGPARARAIIEQREQFGRFDHPLSLDDVHGIGVKTIEWFDDYIVLHPTDS